MRFQLKKPTRTIPHGHGDGMTTFTHAYPNLPYREVAQLYPRAYIQPRTERIADAHQQRLAWPQFRPLS